MQQVDALKLSDVLSKYSVMYCMILLQVYVTYPFLVTYNCLTHTYCFKKELHQHQNN